MAEKDGHAAVPAPVARPTNLRRCLGVHTLVENNSLYSEEFPNARVDRALTLGR
jgi:hypothetical protein